MWPDTSTAPAPSSSGSAVNDFFTNLLGSASKRIDQELVKDHATTNLGTTSTPTYGVNQDGTLFLAGKASFDGKILGVPAPLVLVGVGIVALAFILHSR